MWSTEVSQFRPSCTIGCRYPGNSLLARPLDTASRISTLTAQVYLTTVNPNTAVDMKGQGCICIAAGQLGTPQYWVFKSGEGLELFLSEVPPEEGYVQGPSYGTETKGRRNFIQHRRRNTLEHE